MRLAHGLPQKIELPCMAGEARVCGMNDSISKQDISKQALGIGQEIDGPGRVYFEQPVLDNLLETMMELAAEVWTIRDRQAVMEKVLAEKGIDAAALIEMHVPAAEELAERKALREAFVARLLAGFLRRPEGRKPEGVKGE
jgi:hypothetical protein